MTKLEHIVTTTPPFSFIINKSKHWYLPGFEGLPFFDVMLFFYRKVKTVGLKERASAIAFNFIMALPPALLFLFTLIPNLPFISKKSLKEQLHFIIVDIVPAKMYNGNIIKFVDSFIDGTKIGLISIGLLLALFFASNAMMGLMRSFNKDHIGFEKRKGLLTRWVAIRLTILIFSLVLGCLLLLMAQGVVLKWVGVKSIFWRGVITYARWIFIVGMIFYAIAFIYKLAPAVEKRWKLISPGTIFATVLSILATLGFSAFVNSYGKYNALYGSIGTIIVLMALIYINSLVLLIGFELNLSIKSLKAIADQRQAQRRDAKK